MVTKPLYTEGRIKGPPFFCPFIIFFCGSSSYSRCCCCYLLCRRRRLLLCLSCLFLFISVYPISVCVSLTFFLSLPLSLSTSICVPLSPSSSLPMFPPSLRISAIRDQQDAMRRVRTKEEKKKQSIIKTLERKRVRHNVNTIHNLAFSLAMEVHVGKGGTKERKE